jgi:myo-inositol-1(or 4)-monophosphatase
MNAALPTDPAAWRSCCEQLCTVAIGAARAAGSIIAEHAARAEGEDGWPGEVKLKQEQGASLAASVLTEVDALAQQEILERLAPSRERWGLGLLAEESVDDLSRLRAEAFWCVDPLDGTLPFIEGKAGYAVSVALVGRDGVPLLGVVFDPVKKRLYHALRGGGAYRDEQRWQASPLPRSHIDRPLALFTDRSFAQHPRFGEITAALEKLARQRGRPGLEIHATAGAVMNACSTLERPPACYFKLPKATPGGGNLWDYAATACIACEHGASASDCRGKPLDLNNPQTVMMNHCGICYASNPELAEHLLTQLIPRFLDPPH